jgi:hypothetical protein
VRRRIGREVGKNFKTTSKIAKKERPHEREPIRPNGMDGGYTEDDFNNNGRKEAAFTEAKTCQKNMQFKCKEKGHAKDLACANFVPPNPGTLLLPQSQPSSITT